MRITLIVLIFISSFSYAQVSISLGVSTEVETLPTVVFNGYISETRKNLNTYLFTQVDWEKNAFYLNYGMRYLHDRNNTLEHRSKITIGGGSSPFYTYSSIYNTNYNYSYLTNRLSAGGIIRTTNWAFKIGAAFQLETLIGYKETSNYPYINENKSPFGSFGIDFRPKYQLNEHFFLDFQATTGMLLGTRTHLKRYGVRENHKRFSYVFYELGIGLGYTFK